MKITEMTYDDYVRLRTQGGYIGSMVLKDLKDLAPELYRQYDATYNKKPTKTAPEPEIKTQIEKIDTYDDFLICLREISKLQEYSHYDADNQYQGALNDLLKHDREKYQRYQKLMLKTFAKSHKADIDIQ